jgi:hypothetical protein
MDKKLFNMLYRLWLSCDGDVGKFYSEMDKIEFSLKEKLMIEKGKQEKDNGTA